MAQRRGKQISFYYVLTLLVRAFLHTKAETVEVNLLTENVVWTTSDKFLSVTLGSTEHRTGWRTLKDVPKLHSLATELSPAYFRIGGTVQDYLYWNKTGKEDISYNSSELDRLYNFAQNSRLDLIFGLSALTRKKDGSWNPINAEELFGYMEGKEYSMLWELGNEPDRWPLYNITDIPAERLAKDCERLKDVLKKHGKENTKIYGPDVSYLSSDHDFLERFLKTISSGILDAVTYHHYYEDSHGAKLEDFMNVTKLDRFLNISHEALELVNNSTRSKHTPVWLGETSSTYNSGAKGLSDSYVAGFMWLDKLGLAALANHSVICRQCIYGGYYSLLDSHTLDPLPVRK